MTIFNLARLLPAFLLVAETFAQTTFAESIATKCTTKYGRWPVYEVPTFTKWLEPIKTTATVYTTHYGATITIQPTAATTVTGTIYDWTTLTVTDTLTSTSTSTTTATACATPLSKLKRAEPSTSAAIAVSDKPAPGRYPIEVNCNATTVCITQITSIIKGYATTTLIASTRTQTYTLDVIATTTLTAHTNVTVTTNAMATATIQPPGCCQPGGVCGTYNVIGCGSGFVYGGNPGFSCFCATDVSPNSTSVLPYHYPHVGAMFSDVVPAAGEQPRPLHPHGILRRHHGHVVYQECRLSCRQSMHSKRLLWILCLLHAGHLRGPELQHFASGCCRFPAIAWD